jgi:hypothetical protein
MRRSSQDILRFPEKFYGGGACLSIATTIEEKCKEIQNA